MASNCLISTGTEMGVCPGKVCGRLEPDLRLVWDRGWRCAQRLLRVDLPPPGTFWVWAETSESPALTLPGSLTPLQDCSSQRCIRYQWLLPP